MHQSGNIKAPLEEPADKVLKDPFFNFISAQQSSGWLLLSLAILAVILANSPWADWYFGILALEFGVSLGGTEIVHSLQEWTNNGIMAFFFFLLGLELKRELLNGQLNSLRKASAVIFAALGGMVVPALLFLLLVQGANARVGWAIPVATDAAFALMLLTLLGRHIPNAARAFLVGLAIVDDLGAIVLIALIYTSHVDPSWIAPTIAALSGLTLLNLMGIRNGWIYFLAGFVLWLCFNGLGLHGTLAGVAVAFATPVRPGIPRNYFLSLLKRRTRDLEAEVDKARSSDNEDAKPEEITKNIQNVAERATPPLNRWEMQNEKLISFIVVPVFAFMNAGFILSRESMDAAWPHELSTGIFIGLLVGKPVGIFGGVWLGKVIGAADLPKNISWRHILGLGLLGSIGFTMSLFISALSFSDQNNLSEIAKQAIIVTSVLAGMLGYAMLRWGCPSKSR